MAHDRLSGRDGPPEPGWTGRWFEGGTYVLDGQLDSDQRDSRTTDDVDALATLMGDLDVAIQSGSWAALARVPLLARHDKKEFEPQHRESELAKNISSIEHICRNHFITRIGETSLLLPVSKVRRPARQALTRLSAHTEDWAARTLNGPVARRALAIIREEDADLYENRMVSELVYPILASALAQRIRWLERRQQDLDDLVRAQDEGTPQRRSRLYAFWGKSADQAHEASATTTNTLRLLHGLSQKVQRLRGSPLLLIIGGRRTGQRTLRNTNVIADNRHYRSAGNVWRAYERNPDVDITPDERLSLCQARHRSFDHYVLALVVRALGGLHYVPHQDRLPTHEQPIEVHGPWGEGTVTVHADGIVELSSGKLSTRIVPLLDVVGLDDSADDLVARWRSLDAASPEHTIVALLGDSRELRRLPPPVAAAMSSAGHDLLRPAALTGIPVSPLETASLERVSRAIADALLTPALLAFPYAIRLADRPVPRRLIDHLMNSSIEERQLSPLFHRAGLDDIALRRPPTPKELASMDEAHRRVEDRAKAPGWERDVVGDIPELRRVLAHASLRAARLLQCPRCSKPASPSIVSRSADIFAVECVSCGTAWGHDRCGHCGARVPFIEPERTPRNPEVSGPGWVERIYGADALSSPCWARTTASSYVCPECRSCSVARSQEGAGCQRCHDRPEEGSI